MDEGLILGYTSRESLIGQVEESMKPGEMVMAVNRREVWVGQMVSEQLQVADKGLLLTPPPSYIVISDYGREGVCWTDNPIAFSDRIYRNYGLQRMRIPMGVAIGNDAVSDFASNYLGGNFEFDRNFLNIVRELEIKPDCIQFKDIQKRTAARLIGTLIDNVPAEVMSALAGGENERGDIVFVPDETSTTSENIQKFVGTISGSLALGAIDEALNSLVDSGLLGLGIELKIIQGDDGERLIGVDSYFKHLARHYHPRVIPRRIKQKHFGKESPLWSIMI